MQTFLHATIFPHVKELNMSYPFYRAKNGTNISHGLHFPNLHKFFFRSQHHYTALIWCVSSVVQRNILESEKFLQGGTQNLANAIEILL